MAELVARLVAEVENQWPLPWGSNWSGPAPPDRWARMIARIAGAQSRSIGSRRHSVSRHRGIQGELLRLGIEISASSIRRVIAPKRRPGPKRDTWSTFMRKQAASIVACDLFTIETVRL